jgi:hypothetical protein
MKRIQTSTTVVHDRFGAAIIGPCFSTGEKMQSSSMTPIYRRSRCGGLWAGSQQRDKLVNPEASFGKDVPQSANTNALMVRHDGTGIRCLATHDHVTAFLPTENKTNTFQCDTDGSARQICG